MGTKISDILKRRWENIKWFAKEIIKVGSADKSFFSKKRIFELTAFLSGETTLLSFFFYNISKLTTPEAIAISAVFFAIAGYTLNKTEEAKKTYIKENNLDEPK